MKSQLGVLKYVCAALFVLVLLAVVAGCQNASSTSSGAKGQAFTWKTNKVTFTLSQRIADKVSKGQTLNFKISTWDPAAPFFGDALKGASDFAKASGISVAMVGPSSGTPQDQVSILETLIDADQCDGLLVSCGDADTMVPIINKAIEKGIPVITYDSDSTNSERLTYVGVQQPEIGKMGADALMKLDPTKTGKLAIFTAFASAPYSINRVQGFKTELQANGANYNIIGPFELGIDYSKGYGVVENTFMGNHDIKDVYVTDEYVTDVADYLVKNNLADKVTLVGVNTLDSVLQYVKSGVIKETVGQNPYKQGYQGMQILYNFVTKGTTTPDFNGVQLQDVTPANVS